MLARDTTSFQTWIDSANDCCQTVWRARYKQKLQELRQVGRSYTVDGPRPRRSMEVPSSDRLKAVGAAEASSRRLQRYEHIDFRRLLSLRKRHDDAAGVDV